MASPPGSTDTLEAGYHPWIAAIVAGLLAGVGMGVILSVGTELMPLIGALYGLGSFAGGWIAHLANSVVFALLFAAMLSRPIVQRESFTMATFAGLGMIYGAFLGILSGGILFPLWINTGIAAGLPVPFLPFSGREEWFITSTLFGVSQLVYGLILGPVYALVSRSVPGIPRR